MAARTLADTAGVLGEEGEIGWSGRKPTAVEAEIMAVHSEGESTEVRRKAPGTSGTSCRATGVMGGTHCSGDGMISGDNGEDKRGMALGEEAYTMAGWRFGGLRSGPGVLEQMRKRARI